MGVYRTAIVRASVCPIHLPEWWWCPSLALGLVGFCACRIAHAECRVWRQEGCVEEGRAALETLHHPETRMPNHACRMPTLAAGGMWKRWKGAGLREVMCVRRCPWPQRGLRWLPDARASGRRRNMRSPRQGRASNRWASLAPAGANNLESRSRCWRIWQQPPAALRRQGRGSRETRKDFAFVSACTRAFVPLFPLPPQVPRASGRWLFPSAWPAWARQRASRAMCSRAAAAGGIERRQQGPRRGMRRLPALRRAAVWDGVFAIDAGTAAIAIKVGWQLWVHQYRRHLAPRSCRGARPTPKFSPHRLRPSD